MQDYYGIDLSGIDTKEKRKMLHNCVIPKLGLHVFNCRDNLKQEALLWNVGTQVYVDVTRTIHAVAHSSAWFAYHWVCRRKPARSVEA